MIESLQAREKKNWYGNYFRTCFYEIKFSSKISSLTVAQMRKWKKEISWKKQKKECPLWGSNSRPSDYETDALPTALRRPTQPGVCHGLSRKTQLKTTCTRSTSEKVFWSRQCKLSKIHCTCWKSILVSQNLSKYCVYKVRHSFSSDSTKKRIEPCQTLLESQVQEALYHQKLSGSNQNGREESRKESELF